MKGQFENEASRRARFRCGEWTVSPDTNDLSDGSRTVTVEPRVMDLLCYLSERADKLVDAEELVREVWSGSVVGDDAVYRAIGQLRKALGDRASAPTYVQTVPKRGYRFIAAVSVLPPEPPKSVGGSGPPTQPAPLPPEPLAPAAATNREVLDEGDTAPPPAGLAAKPAQRWRRRSWRLAAGLGLTTVLVIALYLTVRPEVTATGGPFASVAVLPLTYAGSDPDGDLFADGLSQELILSLSKVPTLKVVSRASSFQFKDVRRDLREVGEWLGVEAVVEGSVRRKGDRVRIDVFLADTATGFEVWSKSFDRRPGGLIDLEKAVAREVVQALDDRLLVHARSGPSDGDTTNLEAYDYYLLGVGHGASRRPDNLKRANRMFAQAIALDPEFARAHAGLAAAILLGGYYGHGPFHATLARARPIVGRALTLGQDDAMAWGVSGLLHYLEDNPEAALPAFERSLQLNPGVAVVHMWRGLALEELSGPRVAEPHFERALELDPLNATAAANLALTRASQGHPEESFALLEKIQALRPDAQQIFRVLSRLNGLSGRLAQSLTLARKAEALDPNGPITLAALANAYASLGLSEQVSGVLARAQPAGTGNPALLRALDTVYLATGNWHEYERMVQTVLDQALASDEAIRNHQLRGIYARLGTAKLMLGDHAEAARLLSAALADDSAVTARPDIDPYLCSSLAHSYRVLGRNDDVERTLATCRERVSQARAEGWRTAWLNYGTARTQIAAGDRDAAVASLLAAEKSASVSYQILSKDPVIATLREDHEVAAMLERMREHAAQERDIALNPAGS